MGNRNSKKRDVRGVRDVPEKILFGVGVATGGRRKKSLENGTSYTTRTSLAY